MTSLLFLLMNFPCISNNDMFYGVYFYFHNQQIIDVFLIEFVSIASEKMVGITNI